MEKILRAKVEDFFNSLTPENAGYIPAEKLEQELKNNKDKYFLLDVRKKEDYDNGHIEGAVNNFWFDTAKIIDKLPQDKEIIVICYTGQSASQVRSLLKLLGFNITVLNGGMVNGWQNRPVIK